MFLCVVVCYCVLEGCGGLLLAVLYEQVFIGVKIAESIEPTSVKPEDFMPLLENVQNLDIGTTNQTHVCDIIKSLKTKNSCDTDGLSTKLLQKLAIEISWPLGHIFKLSLNSGVFPARQLQTNITT